MDYKFRINNEGAVKYEVRVYCHGIKKRCRKVERHSFRLADAPLNVATEEAHKNEFEAAALEALGDYMKTYSKAHLVFTYTEVVNGGTRQFFPDDRGFTKLLLGEK